MSFDEITCAIFKFKFFNCRYLHEIGYTDTIIDVRSNRVRSLLGLHDVPGDLKDMVDGNIRSGNALNGGDGALNSTSRRTGTGNVPDNSNNQGNLLKGIDSKTVESWGFRKFQPLCTGVLFSVTLFL